MGRHVSLSWARADTMAILFVTNDLGCLVPAFDGVMFSPQWKDALWDRFCTGAPARHAGPRGPERLRACSRRRRSLGRGDGCAGR